MNVGGGLRSIDNFQNLMVCSFYFPDTSRNFHRNPFISFLVILLTDRQTKKQTCKQTKTNKQTNKQTDRQTTATENITSSKLRLAEVITIKTLKILLCPFIPPFYTDLSIIIYFLFSIGTSPTPPLPPNLTQHSKKFVIWQRGRSLGLT